LNTRITQTAIIALVCIFTPVVLDLVWDYAKGVTWFHIGAVHRIRLTGPGLGSVAIVSGNGVRDCRDVVATEPMTAVKQDDDESDKRHRIHRYKILNNRRALGNQAVTSRTLPKQCPAS